MPGDHHRVGPGRADRPPSTSKASRSSRFTRLRWTAPPTFRDTDSPSRGGRLVSLAAREHVAARARGRRASARGGTRGRNRRCATASSARPADERPARPPSHRQALATLGAPALEREAPGAGSHAGTKAVRTGALALLRLIGAFHGSRPRRAGLQPVYAAADSATSRSPDERRLGGPENPISRGNNAPALFPALCVKAHRSADPGRAPLVYSPALGASWSPSLAHRLAFVPQGVACRCPRTSSPPLPGASSARSSGER